MKTEARIPNAAEFDAFLREKGELIILSPTWERRYDVNEEVAIHTYSLFLDRKPIGMFSDARSSGVWGNGSLRRQSFTGYIPGYRSGQPIKLSCDLRRSRGYVTIRKDRHKSIPFGYSKYSVN